MTTSLLDRLGSIVDDLVDQIEVCPYECSGALLDAMDCIEKLEAENRLLKTTGIVEVAVRNPSVAEYMRHWEGRAEHEMTKIDTSTEAVEALLKDVTQGPWEGRMCLGIPADVCDFGVISLKTGIETTRTWGLDDAYFIAASRELVPALLVERDALQAEVERLSKIVT
jgi:hypothetical protein